MVFFIRGQVKLGIEYNGTRGGCLSFSFHWLFKMDLFICLVSYGYTNIRSIK